MNLIKKIFPDSNPEVKSCLQALDEITSEFDDFSFKSLVKPQVINCLKDVDKTVYSIREDKMNPRTAIFLLISNITGDMLSSGEYHVYRGVLNMTGNELLKVFYYAVKKLEESGFHSAEDAEKDREWVRNQIKTMG